MFRGNTERGVIPVDKGIFDRYKKNKRELPALEKSISRLCDQLEKVDVVSGKVTKSSDSFPYIEEHVTVRMAEPKEAQRIKDALRDKEKRRDKLQDEIASVEMFIDNLPEGMDKQIFEMVYLEGKSRAKVGDVVGYTHGRISQIIIKNLKD